MLSFQLHDNNWHNRQAEHVQLRCWKDIQKGDKLYSKRCIFYNVGGFFSNNETTYQLMLTAPNKVARRQWTENKTLF